MKTFDSQAVSWVLGFVEAWEEVLNSDSLLGILIGFNLVFVAMALNPTLRESGWSNWLLGIAMLTFFLAGRLLVPPSPEREHKKDKSDEEGILQQEFSVVEYHSFFAVRHNASGEERHLGDGVDTLFDADGESLSPGNPGFVKAWEEVLNSDTEDVMNAYFPP